MSVLALVGVALAQDPTLDLQRFVPVGAHQGFVVVGSARQVPAHGVEVQVLGQLGAGGVRRASEVDGAIVVDETVQSLAAAQVRGAYGLTDAVALVLQAPVVHAVQTDQLGVAFGDVRLAARLRPVDEDALGIVVEPFVSFPSGGTGFTRSVVTFGALAGLSKAFGPVHIAAQGGGRLLPIDGYLPVEVGVTHEVLGTFGLGLELSDTFRLNLEAFGAMVGPTNRFSRAEGYQDGLHLPVESLVDVRITPGQTFGLVAGGAVAVSKGVATPSWRAFLGFSVFGRTRPEAPLVVEPAPVEESPAEVAPVPPPVAPPPVVPVAPDPPPVHRGSPDRDRDGVPDAIDPCPTEGEDYDNFLDHDGCPERDNDNDGILDPYDICPVDPELYNGVKDDDGCPDELKVVVTEKRIHILERVQFAHASADLDDASEPVLQALLDTLTRHPEVQVVRVEGHTDDVGDATANQLLSGRRAASVRNWLIEHGIDAERLKAVGKGEEAPLVPNDGPEGREKNRRVELHIERSAPTLDVEIDQSGMAR